MWTRRIVLLSILAAYLAWLYSVSPSLLVVFACAVGLGTTLAGVLLLAMPKRVVEDDEDL